MVVRFGNPGVPPDRGFFRSEDAWDRSPEALARHRDFGWQAVEILISWGTADDFRTSEVRSIPVLIDSVGPYPWVTLNQVAATGPSYCPPLTISAVSA